MPFRKNSAKDSYGRLTKYWSATDAGVLPIYESNYFGTGADGDLSTSGNVSLAATLDGDIVVKNYKNLTINSGHTLTTDNRCRGLLLFVDGNLVVDGTISMTARGCKANPATSGTDGDTPVAPGDGNGVGANGIRFPFLTPGVTTDTLSAAEFQGCGTALYNLIAEFPKLTGKTGHKIIQIARTGAAGAPRHTANNGTNGTAGSVNQSGGGGSGGENAGTGGAGGTGTCFSGAPGGGGGYNTANATDGSNYGGIGGSADGASGGAGAGNPRGTTGANGGTGTGGFLVIVCSGTITVGATGIISSNGVAGGNGGANYGTGGGSGGGNIVLIYAVAYSNGGTVQAAGGLGGNDTYKVAGSGGAGTIQTLAVKA